MPCEIKKKQAEGLSSAFLLSEIEFYRSMTASERIQNICETDQERKDEMRLDKFLKVSRLIKRRTVANEACDAGRVLVNGTVAKASVKVKVGDIIEIQFGTKTVKVEVLDIQDTTKKEEAKDLFRYL